MTQQTTTFLMQGGLDLVTPAVALKPGTAIAAVNYEPDVAGYTRLTGYERFDGSPAPSAGADAADIAARRAAIDPVPGTGPIRGICIFDGRIHAFRDTVSGVGALWRDDSAVGGGWQETGFSYIVPFTAGTAEFLEGETLSGGTSTATATVTRVVVQTGSFAGGDAVGYICISSKALDFQDGEALTSLSGAATCNGQELIELLGGGTYECFVHNFTGPGKRPRMYFVNGVQSALEWDGTNLFPIRSGTTDGPIDLADNILERNGGKIRNRGFGRLMPRKNFDVPIKCAPFANHLFLGFRNGGVVHSGIGDPFDFRTITGAGTFGFPDEITDFLPAAQTAFVIFGRNRVEYLTGTDVDNFVRHELSDASGAYAYTAQMLDEPFFLDDAGLRRMSTTDAFGDWNLGTVTQPIETLIRTKRLAGVRPAASVTVKSKDQYRLFWDDGTGLIVYFGRKHPETMPIKLPITITCASVGELSTDDGGERIFVGADDGYVYELDKGTSFDGAAIPAYVRLVWNTLGAPAQNKRYHKVELDVDAPEDATIGVAFHVDYGRRQDGSGSQVDTTVSAGSRSDWAIDDYDSIDWTQPDQGVLESWLDTIGRNLAISIISESATEEAHTLSSATLNFTPRRAQR